MNQTDNSARLLPWMGHYVRIEISHYYVED